jgi:hypothetical protein
MPLRRSGYPDLSIRDCLINDSFARTDLAPFSTQYPGLNPEAWAYPRGHIPEHLLMSDVATPRKVPSAHSGRCAAMA